MTILLTAAAYLVGATATALYLNARPPVWADPAPIARDLRTARPHATEQQIEHAVSRARFAIILTAAVLWPLVILAAAVDYPGIMWRRWRTQKSTITVGRTVTVHGRPMLITSISEQWGEDGHTATFTCTGSSPRRLPGITIRGDRP